MLGAGYMRTSIVLGLPLLALLLVACAAPAAEEVDADTQNLSGGGVGRVSGYTLDGPRAGDSDRVSVELCEPTDGADEQACDAVGGELRSANGCKLLCTLPMARRGFVAGYDLEGYKQLPSDAVATEVCAWVPEADCTRQRGTIQRANGCRTLCTVPIAESGFTAGYDLEGYKRLPNDRAAATFCEPNEVGPRCTAVGGTAWAANECRALCTLPL